jgi:hypothetical protein
MAEWRLMLLTVLVNSRWRRWAGIVNPMDQSTSWETNSPSSSQDIPHISWNPKFRYHTRKTPWLNHIIPVHSLWTDFLKTHFNITIPSMPRYSKWQPSLTYPQQNCVCNTLLPMCATCLAHLALFDLIIRIMLKYYSIQKIMCKRNLHDTFWYLIY